MGFTFQFLKPDDPYYPHWADLRCRQKLALWSFFAGVPASFLIIGGLLSFYFGNSWIVPLGGLPGALVAFAAVIHRRNWPCPCCGCRFYSTWFDYNPVADHCLHCGLPEYAPRGDM